MRKWLPCQQYILQNGKGAYQNRQQAKGRRFFPSEEKVSNKKSAAMSKVSLLKRKASTV